MKIYISLLLISFPLLCMDKPPKEGTPEWIKIRKEVDRTVKEVENRYYKSSQKKSKIKKKVTPQVK